MSVSQDELPQAVLACMEPEDRVRYSPAVASTASVATLPHATLCDQGKADTRAEKLLQEEFEQWLLLHSYYYYRAPMHKRSMLPLGYPDFTVWLAGSKTAWIEYKTETGRVSPEQVEYHRQLQQRGHFVFTSRSLRFSIDCLKAVENALLSEVKG